MAAVTVKAPEHGPTARCGSRGPQLALRAGGQPEGRPGCEPRDRVAPLRGPPWRSGSTPAVSVTPLCRAAGAGRGRGGGRGGGGPAHPASRRRSLLRGCEARPAAEHPPGSGPAALPAGPGGGGRCLSPGPSGAPTPQLGPSGSISRGSRAAAAAAEPRPFPACPPSPPPNRRGHLQAAGGDYSNVREQRSRLDGPPVPRPRGARCHAVAPARALFAAVSERSGAASSPAPGL